MRLNLVFVLCLFAACAQKPVVEIHPPVEGLPAKEYAQVVAKHTGKANSYVGFYQTYQADVTLLDTEMLAALMKQKAQYLEWDEKTYQSEREKAQQDSSAYAKFFLRFYAPERDYDDLNKPNSIWKVYLDYDGKRFTGTVRKMKEKLIEVKALFPHFDRYSTAYEISFNVPMTTIEHGPLKVSLTSTLGTSEFSFPTGQ